MIHSNQCVIRTRHVSSLPTTVDGEPGPDHLARVQDAEGGEGLDSTQSPVLGRGGSESLYC